ncbi:MAG: hypothetical protein K4571_12310 [Deltaproteobacteria bacterium]
MKKLNKRQIIILAIAALCILYAAYELLIAGPAAKKTKTESKPVASQSFVSALSTDLMKYTIAGADAFIKERAEMSWSKNPFWDRLAYREYVGKEAGSGAAANIIYSGYVDAGPKKMAIINGWEYEAGEFLEIEGYTLKSVSPTRVLIINRNTGGEFYVPIQE